VLEQPAVVLKGRPYRIGRLFLTDRGFRTRRRCRYGSGREVVMRDGQVH
jgi:hypothetical protein